MTECADPAIIARQVVEQLAERPFVYERLVDTAELAAILGVERAWVRANAELLGAYRLGNGTRGRLRFDVREAREALRRCDAEARTAERRRRQRVAALGPKEYPPIRPRRRGKVF